MIEKAAILIARLWVVALLTGSVAAAAESDGPALQPQALNWAGVYALRQIDPNLTGAGVRVGVICRSLTYVDGNPQNDYQPNVKHDCFRNAQLQFHDSRTLTPGESPHSTAVCSILFGDDPAGVMPNLDPFTYQGVVPAAEGHIYELIHFVAQNVHPQNAPKVDVATASFGQELEDWWTRGIEALTEHQGLVFVASIGNGSNCLGAAVLSGRRGQLDRRRRGQLRQYRGPGDETLAFCPGLSARVQRGPDGRRPLQARRHRPRQLPRSGRRQQRRLHDGRQLVELLDAAGRRRGRVCSSRRPSRTRISSWPCLPTAATACSRRS